VIARIAAAVGEAGCMPPTYSLVGDYFPKPAERTRALSVYMLAGPIASLISFVSGGWLNERYGWRATFFLAGIPALLVAVLVKMTISEPRLKADQAQSAPKEELPGMSAVLRTLWNQRSSRHLSLAIILLFTMGYGLGPWYGAFMMRSHSMQTAELGVWLGLIFGVSGMAGILVGGYVAARWFADDERGQMRLSSIMVAALVPCYIAFLLLPGKTQALLALVPLAVVCNFFFGPAFALMQRLVGDEARATALAVVMLLVNLIGMGIGPQVVGVVSDVLIPVAGIDSLRYAMLSVSLISLWAAYHFWQAGQTVKQELTAVKQGEPLYSYEPHVMAASSK
jgi:MFS family permease